MIIKDSLIDEAVFCPSPNFDSRPANGIISLIIIHAISLPPGQYHTQLIKDFFLNVLDAGDNPQLQSIQHLTVSSHLLITREGQLIQFVPFNKRSWHAGISSFDGQEDCNDFSIGIELEGCDDEPFETEQYSTLIKTLDALKAQFSIHPKNIVGHCDVAPDRKTDPGPHFNWSLIRSSV